MRTVVTFSEEKSGRMVRTVLVASVNEVAEGSAPTGRPSPSNAVNANKAVTKKNRCCRWRVMALSLSKKPSSREDGVVLWSLVEGGPPGVQSRRRNLSAARCRSLRSLSFGCCGKAVKSKSRRSKLPAQPLHFRLQRRDPLIALGERGRHVGRLEALGNVLGAIGVPGGNGEEDHLLGTGAVAFRHQLRGQIGCALDDARRAPNLHALAVGVVDQEQKGICVVREIPERDVLAVAGVIDEAERDVVDDPQEAGRAAAVLHVRLPGRVGGGEEHARLRLDERTQIRRDGRCPRSEEHT